MKNKILYSIMAFVLGFCLTACSDSDDYGVNTTPMLKDGSVVTGSADVTSTSAIMHGTVAGLEGQAQSAYTTGFYYGTTEDNLSERVVANSGAEFSASVSGMPGTVYYYQAFVTLQGRVTYKGTVSSLVLTDTKAVTGEYKDLTANSAKLVGQINNTPTDAESGIVISGVAGDERVRAGVRIPGALDANFEVEALGLLPATTYYYAAYVDLGLGVVYGDTKEFTTPGKDFDVDNDLVDLGLSTKWGKCNLGATKETELGALIGFGDLTGFNTSLETTDYASTDIYRTTSDVVSKISGDKATLPTISEYEELFRCCKVEWMEQEGVQGYKFTGPNGNSIFMPAAGSRTQRTTAGVGTEGRYLSGSVNETDSRFAMSYLFNQGGNGRSTTAVYQALSVRPVSVAKNVPFDKTKLYKTWEIDLTVDGEYQIFPGPSYFYGTDDSWRTVTNNEPVVGDVWSWEADFASQSWTVGGDAKNCQGSITFNEDGTVVVKHVDAEGKETVENGTYAIDEENKIISFTDADVLAPANFSGDYVNNLKTNIKILSLTDKSLQLGVLRTDPSQGPCLLSINMVPQLEKYGYKANLTCYGDGTDGEPADAWASATVTIPGGESALGTYTLTFNTTSPRINGKVYVIDIDDFATAYPNAFIRVDAIKADGNDVPFDGNKFFYGDIENGGRYRIEMANIWGCGHNDGWNGLKDTPFHAEGGETTNETALAFNSTFEVTFTIVSLDANLEFNVKQTAVGLNSPWAMPGNWGKENPGALKIVKDNFQYKVGNSGNLALSLTADECSDGVPSNGAVNLIDVVGIRNYFPTFSMALKSVVNDGLNIPFEASKLICGDLEGNGNFRIELHNIWGAGTAANPAFDGAEIVEGNNCVKALGFQNSSVYSVGDFSTELFAKPW